MNLETSWYPGVLLEVLCSLQERMLQVGGLNRAKAHNLYTLQFLNENHQSLPCNCTIYYRVYTVQLFSSRINPLWLFEAFTSKGSFLCSQLGVFIFCSLLLGFQLTLQSSTPWDHTSLKSSKKVSLGAIVCPTLSSWPIYTGNNWRVTLRWCQASLRWYFRNIWANVPAEAARNKTYNSSWNRAQRKMPFKIFAC